MTQIFDEESKKAVVCTVVKSVDCIVAGLKTKEVDGYNAVVFGLGRKHNTTKPEQGKFSTLGYVPMYLKEVRLDSLEGYEVGQKVSPSILESGNSIEVLGTSKGKGFQGVVKRWHFHGGARTHGQSDRMRAPGSIGARTTPGRVWKGKKMSGRMGNDTIIVKSKIVNTDDKNGYVVVKGSIPGARNSILLINSK